MKARVKKYILAKVRRWYPVYLFMVFLIMGILSYDVGETVSPYIYALLWLVFTTLPLIIILALKPKK